MGDHVLVRVDYVVIIIFVDRQAIKINTERFLEVVRDRFHINRENRVHDVASDFERVVQNKTQVDPVFSAAEIRTDDHRLCGRCGGLGLDYFGVPAATSWVIRAGVECVRSAIIAITPSKHVFCANEWHVIARIVFSLWKHIGTICAVDVLRVAGPTIVLVLSESLR